MSPEYREIPVDLIRFSPFNTRGEVPEEEIKALAETMKGGNDVPIKVRLTKGEPPYEVVYGDRRIRAHKLAGISTARCIVEDMDDAEVLMQQWMENEEHRDLPDYGKALKLRQLLDATKINQADLGKKLGKDQQWVSHHIAMLRLESKFTSRDVLWALSEKQARAILSAGDDLLPKAIEEFNYWSEIHDDELPSANDIDKLVYALKNDKRLEKAKGEYPSPPHEHFADPGSTTCKVCGRELTAPESVKAGIGPICAEGGKPEGSGVGSEVGKTEPPKPLTLEDRAYQLLDELHTKFGTPSDSFMIDQLRDKLRIYRPDNDKLIAKYKARAKPPPTKQEEKPKIPFKLVEVKDGLDESPPQYTTCPLCGQTDTQQHIDEAINALTEYLVTSGTLPLGLAEKVEQALRRHPQEEDEEVLAAESEAQAQMEDEDLEEEEREDEVAEIEEARQ